jgi:hypothetical protein
MEVVELFKSNARDFSLNANGRQFRNELISFLEEEGCKSVEHRILGCSEAIESLFGVYKDRASHGNKVSKKLGRLILLISARVVNITKETITEALETVRWSCVREFLGSF